MICFFKKKKKELTNEYKLWYMVSNGGDGSASVNFYESEKLAELIDDNQDEGFAESTVSWISIMSDGDVHINENIHTVEDEILEMEDDWDYLVKYRNGDQERILAILMNMKVDKDNV